LLAIYQGYQYVSVSDKLYKLFNPSAHMLGSTILDLDLTCIELLSSDAQRSTSPLTSTEQISVHRLITALQNARDDPRVSGLVVRGVTGLRKIGLSEISELRSAIRNFSEGWGGKPSMLHVPEGLGLAGNGTIPLYFASAFDAAHVQPTSSVIIPGLSFGSVFLKGTLDKLGITPIKVARKEYKTAANTFTESEFTPAHRESTEAILESINKVLVEGVSSGRGIPKHRVVDAINVGIMTAPEAVAKNLLDSCAYRDELPALMRNMLDKGVKQREEQRRSAAAEWQNAMRNLADEWLRNDQAELKRWNKGRLIADIGALEIALPAISSFGDPARGDDVRRVVEAELRALRAHIAWMDTRPWEAISRRERPHHIAFSIGNAASIVELERRLCKESIKALETFQVDVAEHRLENGALPLSKAKKILRWTRAMWRAKALSARMVLSILDSQSLTENTGVPLDKADLADKSQIAVLPGLAEKDDASNVGGASLARKGSDELPAFNPYVPRMFLLHQTGDPINTFEGTATGRDATNFNVKHAKTGLWKDRLRYVRITEYVESTTQELSAAQRRLSTWFRSAPPTLKGIPDGEHVGGLIDSAEQFALFRLANSSVIFAQPWRMYPLRNSATVAVIDIQGAISDDSAEDIRAHIRCAEKDSRVHAIVLRVDSPGGSASASDLIARAVEVAKKPIIASMGNVCASGGYFISAPCDKIFAEPATITGSIGVIFSSFRLTGLYEKLGLTVDSVERGRFAKYFGAAGTVAEWDADFKDRIDHIIDDFYQSFVSVAARGRGMPFHQLEKIARGRVWSGDDAFKLGLIDHIGGLAEATKMAAEMAGAAPDAAIRGVVYPSIPMLLESRLRRLGVIPSHLDEEGDERISSDRKRRRSGLRMFALVDDSDDDDDDSRDVDSGDSSSDDDRNKSDNNTAVTSETGTAKSNNSQKSLSNGNAFLTGWRNQIWPSTQADFRERLSAASVLWLLRSLDDHVLGICPNRFVQSAVGMLAGLVSGEQGSSSIIAAELAAARATNGKLAAVMSPQIHVNGLEFSSSDPGRTS
jgi:signal peptide peptidase SppA